ncbi:MAG: hypothetical protein LBC27_00150 [Spirochaetaceae bacterium]|jgi:hypothetical protein|nr:hypothetical protein [Spirochaetaceae bacterium]
MKLSRLNAPAALVTGALAFAALAFLCSCDVPVDRGVFNPANVPADQLVKLVISPNLAISKVDNYQVFWTRPDNNYSQTVKISPGIHMFEINYNDGTTWTIQPISVVAKFVTGKEYKITQTIQGASIAIKITYDENGTEQSALFNMNSLSDDDGPLAVYVKTVFNPTLANPEASILLSNDSTDILFEHDLVYRKTDKNTGSKTEGRYAIEMDFTLGGRIYFLEANLSELSSEAFLAGNFRQDAQVIATPVQCDGKTVTYRYSKPESMAGQEELFVITDLTPVVEAAVMDVLPVTEGD